MFALPLFTPSIEYMLIFILLLFILFVFWKYILESFLGLWIFVKELSRDFSLLMNSFFKMQLLLLFFNILVESGLGLLLFDVFDELFKILFEFNSIFKFVEALINLFLCFCFLFSLSFFSFSLFNSVLILWCITVWFIFWGFKMLFFFLF